MYLYCFVVTVSVFTILVAGLYTREIVPFEQGILLVLIITSCFNLAFILFQPCLYFIFPVLLVLFSLFCCYNFPCCVVLLFFSVCFVQQLPCFVVFFLCFVYLVLLMFVVLLWKGSLLGVLYLIQSAKFPKKFNWVHSCNSLGLIYFVYPLKTVVESTKKQKQS